MSKELVEALEEITITFHAVDMIETARKALAAYRSKQQAESNSFPNCQEDLDPTYGSPNNSVRRFDPNKPILQLGNTEVSELTPEILNEIIDTLTYYSTPTTYRSPSSGFVLQYDPAPSQIAIDKGNRAASILNRLLKGIDRVG